MKKLQKIIIFCPYPFDLAPGQRFRYEQYLDILQESYSVKVLPFLDDKTNDILYRPGFYFRKILGILKGFLKRFLSIPEVLSADFVFIFREASPIGPPVFEWLIAKVFKKKVIYDFDDAIWLPNTSKENKLASYFKYHQKVKKICKWAYKVSCGNKFLAEFASQFNENVIINPTTINTEQYHNRLKEHSGDRVIIGWTGTHSTLKYLNLLEPILKKLQEESGVEIIIISNHSPSLDFDFKFIQWNKETEIQDLLRINIGVMPLSDDDWSRGKCGFKALQYMSLGIPAVVSPVGVNSEIVDHGVNGFLCKESDQWYRYLSLLIQEAETRKTFGEKAREKVVENYSVKSNKDNFLSLFKI